MTNELIKVTFDRVIQTRNYTAVILKNADVKFAIFAEPHVGHFLKMQLSGEQRKRPLSHDLLSMVFQSFSIQVKQIIISDLQDSVFIAKLFLEMHKDGLVHIAEIDARPSDCIILAFMYNAPVFCAQNVLSRIVPYVE